MGAAFNLDTIPGDFRVPITARQFRWAQGADTGAGDDRPVVIVMEGTSDGTEPVETLGTPIASPKDAELRMGKRSKALWAYKMLTSLDKSAMRVYFVRVAEGGGATASTRVYTFATTAVQPKIP
jgi:phage tail sheath gpL-like